MFTKRSLFDNQSYCDNDYFIFRLKTLEKEARLELKKEILKEDTTMTAKSSHSYKPKAAITVATEAGERRFEGISDQFAKDLRKWEEKRRVPPEESTLALLKERKTIPRITSRIRTESESSSSSRDLLSEKSEQRTSRDLESEEPAVKEYSEADKDSDAKQKSLRLRQTEHRPLEVTAADPKRESVTSDYQSLSPASPDHTSDHSAPPVYFYDGNELSESEMGIIASAFEPIRMDQLFDMTNSFQSDVSPSQYSEGDKVTTKEILLEELREHKNENEQLRADVRVLQGQLKRDQERGLD